MLISDKMNKAMNEQIGNEFGAQLQYVAIASYFDSENLGVLAAHFYRQAEEERDHAMKFVKYIIETGGRVAIPAVPAPKASFGSAEEAVKLSLEWETTVTRQINALTDLAIQENDHLSRNFLIWFVNEQLEEVSSMDRLLSLVRRAGEKGLLMVEELMTHHAAAAAKSPSNT